MRKTYGNTWWGQQFLQALQRIDFSNRLPRGRSYANKGAVLKIDIETKTVFAKVQGSRRSPYKQEISMDPLSANRQEEIVRAITDNPFLLSQLLNRQLPPALNEELEQLGIHLFPRSWKDVEATCSCPDWAVPCKHLAAVIYTLANEVDKNPFLVFQLNGMDVMAALEERGFTQSGALKGHLPELSKSLQENPDTSAPLSLEVTLSALDFSLMPDCREKLLRLLPAKPAFYPGKDFKLILDKWYKQVSRAATSFDSYTKSDSPAFPYDVESLTFELDDELKARQVIARTGHGSLRLDQKYPNALEAILAQLNELEPSTAPEVLLFLEALWQFALHLMEKSAIIPQVVRLSEDHFRLRWIPATVDPVVKRLSRQFAAGFPSELVLYYQGGNQLGYFEREEQFRWLLSLMVECFVHSETDLDPENSIKALFFNDFLYFSDRFEERETPYAIQQWLQRFYLSARDFVPVLKVEEAEPDFLLSFWVEDKTKPLAPLTSLSDLFTKKKHAERRIKILQDMASLEEFLPEIRIAVSSKGKKAIRLDSESFVQVLSNTLPALELIGIRILLPKALQRIARPQASLELSEFGNKHAAKTYLDLREMLTFRWQVAIGDQMMGSQDFLQQVKNLRGLVKIQESYVLIDEKEMKALLKKLENPPQLNANDLLKSGLSEQYEDHPVHLSKKARKLIRQLIEQEEIPPPTTLQATLRPYQERGFGWLYKNDRIGFGSILADDMGLGKTLQVIAFLTQLMQEGQLQKRKAIVVVPTTLLTNWEREIAKFSPELRTTIFHGPGRQLDLEAGEVILTSYGVARSDEGLLGKIKWRVLIIDEAQAIKNPGTAQTKSLKKIKAETRIAMSGTPVENRLSEYWSIFDFANKGYLSSLSKFKKTYIVPIEKDRDQARLDQFLTLTSPFILRRVKTDKSIISDLPDKIEQDQMCNLTPEQTALYQGVVENNIAAIEENEGIARAGMIFKLMTALKQICNHPSHFLKKEETDPTLSGKAAYLMELLDQIRSQGEKVLIFTQYREMGELLKQMIASRYPEEPLLLHGGLRRKQRDELVETFQTQPYAWAFILSLKAGGTGLNLTAANHVVHYDLWWNPAVEAQATDRAFRIGQQKNVLVNRLITQGTFEEKINGMISQKRELANLTVKSGENWIGKLSNTELKEIFTLE